jgi:hypothetical protein
MMHVNRKESSGPHTLGVFALAVSVGLVAYGIGMFGNAAIERLTSSFTVHANPTGPILVTAAKPVESNSMAVPAYLPAQFVPEETRAADAAPLNSF